METTRWHTSAGCQLRMLLMGHLLASDRTQGTSWVHQDPRTSVPPLYATPQNLGGMEGEGCWAWHPCFIASLSPRSSLIWLVRSSHSAFGGMYELSPAAAPKLRQGSQMSFTHRLLASSHSEQSHARRHSRCLAQKGKTTTPDLPNFLSPENPQTLLRSCP